MVDFNPKVNIDPNAQNWTGASGKPDASNYRADKSMETLFSGVGELVSGAATSIQTGMTNRIKADWNKDFNPVRDAQGVGDYAEGARVGLNSPGEGLDADGKPLPSKSVGNIPDADKGSFAERAQKLQIAKEEDRISPTAYYGQLEALTRQMKARYPGYGDEVDAVVRHSTGIVPANALRNAIDEKLNTMKSEKDKAAQDEAKWIGENMRYAPESMLALWRSTGKKPTKAELEPYVYQAQADEQMMSAGKARLALAASRNEATSIEGLRQAGESMVKATERVFSEALSALGGDNSTISRALKSGVAVPENERQLITTQFVAFRASYEQRMHQVAEGYAKYINDPAKVKTLVDLQMQKVDSIGKMLGAGDTSGATMTANALKGHRDANALRLYNDSAFQRAVDTLSSLNGGKEVSAAIVMNPANGFLSEGVKAAQHFFTSQAAAGITEPGKSNMTKFNQELGKQYGGLDKVPASVAKDFIDKHVELLSSNKTSPEIRANIAKDLFSDPRVMSTIKRDQRAVAFNQIASPAISAKMIELKTSHPEAFKSYSEWIKSNFMKVAKIEGDKMNSVGSSVLDPTYLNITFDPKSNQFVPSLTQEGIKYADALKKVHSAGVGGRVSMVNSSDPMTLVMGNDSSMRDFSRSINSMNTLIKTVEPILKEGNYDVGREMGNMLKAMGVQTGPSPDGKPRPQTFWNGLGKAISAAVQSPMKAEGDQSQMNSFGGSAINFQQASGGNKGTGSREAPGALEIRSANEQPAVPGGLGAALGDNVFSSESTPLSDQIQRSQKAQEILRQEPGRVIPGKNTTRAQDGGDPGVISGESGSDSNENNTDSSGNGLTMSDEDKFTVKPGDKLALFAGKGAQTDTGALGLAQMLEKKGSSPSEIRSATDPQDGQRTGWFRGDDNKWKFEITDSEAALDHKAIKSLGSRDEKGRTVTATLQDILKHPTFFEMYPEFKDIKVESLDKDAVNRGVSGSFRNGILRLNPKLGKEELMSTVLHEIQHSIQDKENFASGGSPLFAKDDIRRNLLKRLGEIIDDPNKSSNSKEVTKLMDEIAGLKGVGDFNAYQRLGGENESRNVEARRTMSIKQLRKSMPSDSSDYKKGDQFNIPSKER